MEIRGLEKGYDGKTLFRDFEYTFVKQERLGVIGHNGCGKTTLLRLLMGQETPDAGTIEIGQTVKIGYFSQESGELDPNQKVLDSVKDIAEVVETPEGKITASKMLERFLFEGGLQHALIGKLSGGERRRLALLHVLMSAPNVLILDEPTNDLDIQTLSILEDYLDQFQGIVLVVSHDRYFLDRVVRRILAFEDGQIRQYEGGYSDYLEKYKAEHAESDGSGRGQSAAVEGSGSGRNWKESQKPKLKFSYQEQREYETIDADIAKLESQIEEVDQKMVEFASSYGKLSELTAQKEQLEEKLAEKMDRWVYLTELAEKIEQEKEKR